MRILLIEDELKVSEFIRRGLTEEGYRVVVAADGEEGAFEASQGAFDVVILDVMLPKKDGFAVLAELRGAGNTVPVIMLTALGEVEDRVHGLETGADDYLPKPFSFDELLARIQALMRRSQALQTTAAITLADLHLDPVSRQVSRAGQEIQLTAKEYSLLLYFMQNPGKVLSRARLTEHVWGGTEESFTNVVDVYVNYLRKKIDKGFDPPLIHTVRGAGYVLRLPE
ncbi:MAG: DNA-binding response regulator [Nitrospirae bacterium CG18_big_fil_WC_8_21_14_2_50_70_55]|nr:response regulator transcription factor [Deltaproteobacteria bacterium]OIP65034.1 MAG: DNA-binding response regulator [Nitrospirae bacterium CG2_30_70_394]PIQ04321.1 MAG: DNA-binding response regulator [Nitrospirae bacterium CG18_big_fil_WC_8_21_14_2_50_70_55]PIU78654.1 MAG: DNA-binding response regulator [Nitrospirae bacterium CG06_land_8_20_14_3_00_70_43]PIW83626.1 MAG: DNA-binding response regulator [Nitrospirae bacterium CG_4_8_14_3_um_filter_70_85]PIX82745.1 MAG: DNA-binding response r